MGEEEGEGEGEERQDGMLLLVIVDWGEGAKEEEEGGRVLFVLVVLPAGGEAQDVVADSGDGSCTKILFSATRGFRISPRYRCI